MHDLAGDDPLVHKMTKSNKEVSPTESVGQLSDHDWTVRALNIQGIFFQRRCESEIIAAAPWKVVSSEYPVEFPPPNGLLRGETGRLDLRAQLDSKGIRFTVLVECKKSNPEFTDWVFFEKRALENGEVFRSKIQIKTESNGRWNPEMSLYPEKGTPVANEAWETRGNYTDYKKGDKTKTTNTNIENAARQITLASQAIAHEEFTNLIRLSNASKSAPTWQNQAIIPVIVTTANLKVCSFDDKNVVLSSGEIHPGKVELKEVPLLYYEYPIPKLFQWSPKDATGVYEQGGIERFVRKHILVVQSEHFPKLLKDTLEALSKPEEAGVSNQTLN